MSLNTLALLATCVSVLVCAVQANDPAGSWLAYTIAAGAPASKITSMTATTVIPPNPLQGGATPAFWPGLEPSPATNILQPIVKWQGDQWQIFVEYFQWSNFYDWQSSPINVQPGDKIFTSITYVAHNNSYNMYVHSARLNQGIGGNIPVQQGKTYVSAYLVVEHQPNSCSQYPPSNNITWTDITVKWDNGDVLTSAPSAASPEFAHVTKGVDAATAGPQWTAHTYQDQCNTKGHVLSNGNVQFTWES